MVLLLPSLAARNNGVWDTSGTRREFHFLVQTQPQQQRFMIRVLTSHYWYSLSKRKNDPSFEYSKAR
jgi:hypothetical protein